MARARARVVILVGMVLACWACASALDPSLDLSQYGHTSWKVRDGFLRSGIGSIAQTHDGYLWLGTESGLYRFDGVRAVPWQPPAGQRLPSEFIYSLLVARDGALWVGTRHGLASWKDGKLTRYPELAESVIYSLVEDQEGIVWSATEVVGASPIQSRLCGVQSGRVQCVGTFQHGIEWVYPDSKGNLWTGGADGLWRWKPGLPQHYDNSRIGRAIEDERGTLLLAGQQGLKQVVDGRVEKYTLPGIDWPFTPIRLFRSNDGSIWIGTADRGLIQVHRGRADWFAQPDGLSDNDVWSFFEDSEGNVWMGTRGGLDRFRDVAVPTISSRQGLGDDSVWSVLAARDGSVWLGSPSGVSRWKDGGVTIYRRPHPKESALGAPQSHPSLTNAVREINDSGLPDRAESLFENDVGRIWVTTSAGIVRWDGSRFALVKDIPGREVYAMAEDRQGNVWIASEEHGLVRVPRQGEAEQIPWSRLGSGNYAISMAIDPLQDGIWLGFFRGGIAYWKDGQVRMSYSEQDGLGKGWVSALRFGSSGALWAATQGGLSRIKNGHVATLGGRNGLPCDTVHWSMEDDEHAVWLYMPCGLVRIERFGSGCVGGRSEAHHPS